MDLNIFGPPREWVTAPYDRRIRGLLITNPFTSMIPFTPYCQVCGLMVTGHCRTCCEEELKIHLERLHPDEVNRAKRGILSTLFGVQDYEPPSTDGYVPTQMYW